MKNSNFFLQINIKYKTIKMSDHRLGEIVIERPRHGMRLSLKKVTGNKKILDKITHEAITDGLLSPYIIKPRKKTKYFSDHLGPLYRWLRSQVGQPWDNVYSKICTMLDMRTLCGQHIASHMWDFVEINVVLIDGVAYRKENQKTPLAKFGWRWKHQLYVHPDTGILCLLEKLPKQTEKQRDDLLVIDRYHEYRKLNDLWYLVTFQNIPNNNLNGDFILKSEIERWAELSDDRGIYAVSKRQCNKKEVKFILQELKKQIPS